MTNQGKEFVGFDYMEVPARGTMASMYVDSYRNFGWECEGMSGETEDGTVTLMFKRDRKIRNKAELSRLQGHFEACAHEIESLERSKTTAATIAAFTIGVVGTVFLGGAVFAYLGGMLLMMVILAVPGFLGWIAPYFSYRRIFQRKSEQILPLIEQKIDEIYGVCEQGSRLLTA